MYEDYYGFVEKPFSLTPDPKYLFRSASHASAFDLLQYGIRRREGFLVVTGDIGTGKTTLCRALLDQLDRKTFTALILNPFLSEEELLRQILVDFGLVSRECVKRGGLAGVSRQELINTLNEFLLSLVPLRARAILIIDEAQHLPVEVLEQIRLLSNLETDKDKLLQVVLVGQLNLQPVLRSPRMRQLDQRISIRYELKPLDREEVAAYVAHRLIIAGGGGVSFSPRALDLVYRYSDGIPRLVNLLCDRALLVGYSMRTARIVPKIVARAAQSLQLPRPRRSFFAGVRRRAAAAVAAAAVLGLATASVATGHVPVGSLLGAVEPPPPPERSLPAEIAPARPPGGRALESAGTSGADASRPAAAGTGASAEGRYAVLVGSFRREAEAAMLAAQLDDLGYRAFRQDVDLGERGVWRQVLVGRYASVAHARDAEARLRQLPGYADAHLTAQRAGASPR